MTALIAAAYAQEAETESEEQQAAPAGDAAAPEQQAGTETVLHESADEHAEQGLLSPEIVIFLALIVLVAAVFRPAKRAFLDMLDKRADRIRNELEEAQRLREEAQASLAAFQRRQRDAMREAEEIIAHARQEAERLRERSLGELEAALKRREATALMRISQAEQSATQEVRNVAVDIAIRAVADVIERKVGKGDKNAILDKAITELPQHLQ